MIVDSSALLAILREEDDSEQFLTAIDQAARPKMSAASFVETSIVADSQAGVAGGRDLDAFIRHAGIIIEPVTEEQAHIARQAYLDFGKGRHRAGLNFGDCFAYALSKATGEALLFKGQDFRRTDIECAL